MDHEVPMLQYHEMLPTDDDYEADGDDHKIHQHKRALKIRRLLLELTPN